MGKYSRWVRPEVYILVGATAFVLGLSGSQLIRNICGHPEVRVDKGKRAAGILDNHAEGEKHSQHFIRRGVRGMKPEIMPSINKYFSDHTKN